MKKIIIVLLLITLIVSIAACQKTTEDTENIDKETSTSNEDLTDLGLGTEDINDSSVDDLSVDDLDVL